MARIAQEAIEYEIKRFLRPDWRRFWKPGRENDPLYKLYESVERKFDPNQPRVPNGQPDGGQWTNSDGGTAAEPLPSTNGRISRQVALDCDLMHRQDLFICRAVRLRACYEQAYLRLTNCQVGRPIPPLNF